MSPPAPGTDDLAALARKYRALAALRASRDRDEPATTRTTLRALAERHPGCLRELDTLGAVELARRATAAGRAARGGALEPWMAWIWAYHALTRAALALKRSRGRSGPKASRKPAPKAAELPALAVALGRDAGIPVDHAFARAVLRPPGGRLGPVVLATLGVLFETPATEIAQALFPVRRPSPYTLR